MTPEIKARIAQIRRGEVPEGYKKAKYETVPYDWNETKLEDLSENITKGATPTTYGYSWEDSGVLFLKSDCVSDDGFVNREPVFISEEAHKTMKRSKVTAGDILVSITGYLGKVGVVPDNIIEANINQHIARVRPIKDKCNSNYIYYFLGLNAIKRWFEVIQTGQAYPQLSLEQIRNIKIALPPLEEQQKIASILTTQDKVIELKEKLLGEKQRQKKALMQKLLTGKQRMKASDVPWQYVPLEKVSSPVRLKAEKQRYEILSISAGKGFVNQAEKFGKEIAGEQYKNYTVIQRGDFSYNKGNSKKYPQGCVYPLEDREAAVVPNVFVSFRMDAKKCVVGYYKFLFEQGWLNKQLFGKINFGVRNDGLLNLRDSDFYKCVVPVPPLDEQTAIAEILSTADREIDLLQKEIEQEKQKKKALMQMLLTGIVRV